MHLYHIHVGLTPALLPLVMLVFSLIRANITIRMAACIFKSGSLKLDTFCKENVKESPSAIM